jgi:hypothetical protein
LSPFPDPAARSPSAGHFFVVGCPRSGTTLLSVLLDRHSRLCVPPETAFFDEIAPRLPAVRDDAALLQVLRAWRRLPELQLEAPAVLAHLLSQSGGPLSPERVLSGLLDLYAQARGKPRCGEKTPQHLAHAHTLLRCFPDAPILCLLRDGRDVALSLRSMPWWPGSDLKAAAHHWKSCLRQMEACVQAAPDRFQVVRYEDLAARPEATLASVMAALHEHFEPWQLDAARPSGVVLARSRAWKGQALEAVDAARTGARRVAADPQELAWLDEVLGDDLRHLGYLEP